MNRMVKLLIGSALIIVSLCYGLISCEKRLIDYRNKYCGDYYFEVSETLNVGSESTVTTSEYEGSVSYIKENGRNEILINYNPSSAAALLVSKSGILSEEDSPKSNLSGQFYGVDSLHYVFTYSISPAAAGSRTVSGKRTK